VSNINKLVQEAANPGLGKTTAVLTGLGGAYTGGAISGSYHAKKAEQAEKELARREGREDHYKSDQIGRRMGYSALGMLPGVGAITNYMAAKKHYDAVKKLDDIKNKSEKK
jgi:hypothetical protein